jgi:hypothetical protein
VVKFKKKCAFSQWNFLIFLPRDPDSQYGSGSTNSLNSDKIWIRIHNPVRNYQ